MNYKINLEARKMKAWSILARHKWVSGTTITESISNIDTHNRRFTATIRGWGNFVIYEGPLDSVLEISKLVQLQVMKIRDRIDSGDMTVFNEDSKIILA
jgi:hypothetical protein